MPNKGKFCNICSSINNSSPSLSTYWLSSGCSSWLVPGWGTWLLPSAGWDEDGSFLTSAGCGDGECFLAASATNAAFRAGEAGRGESVPSLIMGNSGWLSIPCLKHKITKLHLLPPFRLFYLLFNRGGEGVKATFSVRCKTFWTFHNKLHNMKALLILSHQDHHFSHLLVFMNKNELLWVPVSSSGVFLREKTPHSSLFQHRSSYNDLCPNF